MLDQDGKDALPLSMLFDFMKLRPYTYIDLLLSVCHATFSYTFLAGPFHQRAVNDYCDGSGGECSKADRIGNDCLAIIATEGRFLEQNDTPEKAKKVRDCICDGSYWAHFNAYVASHYHAIRRSLILVNGRLIMQMP